MNYFPQTSKSASAAFFGGLAVLAGILTGSAQTPVEVRIATVEGKVEVSPAGAETWVLTQTNQTLRVSDRVRTLANSRASLLWSDHSVVNMGPLTELEILPPPPDEEPGLHFFRGVVSFFHRDKPGRIRIITPGANAGIEGTEFVLESTNTNATILSVIDGKVRLTNNVAPGIPVSALASANQTLKATLQEVDTYLLFNDRSGFYARFEAHWYGQDNAGWTPAEPAVSFVQENIFAGYRFLRRRAELQLGSLNLSGGDYDLNPLTVYQELPRKRVFEARFNFIF